MKRFLNSLGTFALILVAISVFVISLPALIFFSIAFILMSVACAFVPSSKEDDNDWVP